MRYTVTKLHTCLVALGCVSAAVCAAAEAQGLRGNLDGVKGGGSVYGCTPPCHTNTLSGWTVDGWAVDPARDGGRTPVNVSVWFNGVVVASALANRARPDLVKNHVAPDPDHGFTIPLPATVVRVLASKQSEPGVLEARVGTAVLHSGGCNATTCQDKDPMECVPIPLQGDCAAEGSYVCIAPQQLANWPISGVSGQGAFGYCHVNHSVSSGWECCRHRQNTKPLQPAPPRLGKRYPLPPTQRPKRGTANVVFFITDDQDVELGSVHVMNTTRSLLADGGTTMHNFFVTTPICCPSRISYLSGRYAHNTGAVSTSPAGWCSNGIFWKGPGQKVALPTYVRASGVSTGIFGKETNANDDTYISPGWDRFFVLGGASEGHYYADWFNDQGKRFTANSSQYMTDLIADRAITWLTEQLSANKRFFAYVAPHAPHTRATPSPDTEGYFFGEKSPRLPSWNKSMPHHHWVVREQEPLTRKCIEASDDLYRNRLRSLLGVDSLVGEVADLITSHGKLDSTYFIYTSDHGFHLGEMNMPYFKGQPYDTDLRVPFMIRGPGIRPGVTLQHIGLNIDVAPTIAALLGTSPPPEAEVDGRNLAPILMEETRIAPAAWRKDFLFEFWAGGKIGATPPRGPYCHHMITAVNNTYAGVRTLDGYKYVDFSPYEDIQEAFNLNKDQYEMDNLARAGAPNLPWMAALKARLAQLRNCSKQSCRKSG